MVYALIGAKPLRIGFDKIDGFIRAYNGTRYLVLLRPIKYSAIYNRIKYLVTQKSDVISLFYDFPRNYTKIERISFDSLSLEKILTLHNFIILIKSLFDNNQSHYYYNVFLEKCLYHLAEQ